MVKMQVKKTTHIKGTHASYERRSRWLVLTIRCVNILLKSPMKNYGWA